MAGNEIFELVSKILGILAAVLAVFTGTFGVFTYFHDSKRKKRSETMEAYNRLQQEVFVHLNEWLDMQRLEYAVETADSDGYLKLEDALARIEHFCVGINKNVYDFETFYQMSHGYFDFKLQRKLKPLLEKKLNKHDGAEDFYNNLHNVWKRMSKRSARQLR